MEKKEAKPKDATMMITDAGQLEMWIPLKTMRADVTRYGHNPKRLLHARYNVGKRRCRS